MITAKVYIAPLRERFKQGAYEFMDSVMESVILIGLPLVAMLYVVVLFLVGVACFVYLVRLIGGAA